MAADVDLSGSIAALVRSLQESIDQLLEFDVSTLNSADVVDALREIERAGRRLPSARSALLAEVVSRGLAAQHGCRSTAAFLRTVLRCSAGEAAGWIGQASDLGPGRSLSTGELLPPPLPVLAAAVAAGDVSAEQVRIVRHAMAGIPAAIDEPTRAAAEEQLVEQARLLDPGQLSRVAARLLACLDPDGVLGSTERERQARRSFIIGRQDRHGMVPVSGLLDPETGALLSAALEPLATPKHTADERDLRTRPQRCHDALRDATRLLLSGDCLPTQSGVPATLLLTASLEQIEERSGVVSTAHGGLLPVEQVIRLAAQARVIPIVFDTDGIPLWCGRGRRLASLHQRLVLTAMDRGCVYPGCDVPAIRCEVMHLDDWAQGGNTDIDRLALGCDYHHHRLAGWQLERHAGRINCIPPPWIDPDQQPRINSTFHDPQLLPVPKGRQHRGGARSMSGSITGTLSHGGRNVVAGPDHEQNPHTVDR